MNKEEQHIALAKWMEGTLSKTEEAELSKTVDLVQLRTLLKAQKQYNIEVRPVETMWADMEQKMQGAQAHKNESNTWIWAVVFAGFILLGWLSYQTFFAKTKVETVPKETQEILYADGTRVQLSPDSKLRYDESNWENQRLLSLDGQAFFDVKKGSAFIVETPQGTIKVLGTQFDIWVGDDAMRVQCFEGSVQVRKGESQTVLEVGQQVRVNNTGNFAVEKFVAQTPDWLRNERVYQQDKISDVLDDITRFYDVQVLLNGIDKDATFSGTLPTDNLENAARYLASSMAWTYEIGTDKISFSTQ